MSFKFIIAFAIGVAIYLCGLGVFVLIKRAINKKKLQKELEEQEQRAENEVIEDVNYEQEESK